ncbi:MAG: uracil-DNA glycosylase [Azoarcus sp.]|jgi:DNA polymerase|nr:uracil-DNA glycosylase [Azoarcus sp.]
MTPRRAAILREMGLAPIWRVRAVEAETIETPPVTPEPVGANDYSPPPRPKTEIAAGNTTNAASANGPDTNVTSADDARANNYSPLQNPASPPSNVSAMDWPELEAAIRECRACVLCKQRRQAVPGVGDRKARWMFVGEGPGAEEDRRGEPFVGAAGKLLDNMLAALGLKRGEGVYIANAVKCRPPLNRTPEVGEIAACAPFLDRQIALVQPGLLIALGRPAAQALLGREISISAARGKRFEKDGVPVVVTYHPAYLLRNPLDKAKVWEDLCFARRILNEAAARN